MPTPRRKTNPKYTLTDDDKDFIRLVIHDEIHDAIEKQTDSCQGRFDDRYIKRGSNGHTYAFDGAGMTKEKPATSPPAQQGSLYISIPQKMIRSKEFYIFIILICMFLFLLTGDSRFMSIIGGFLP